MTVLSQAYLEWEQQTEARGEARGEQRGAVQAAKTLILQLLTRRVGDLPNSVRSQIEALSLTQLEALGDAIGFEQAQCCR